MYQTGNSTMHVWFKKGSKAPYCSTLGYRAEEREGGKRKNELPGFAINTHTHTHTMVSLWHPNALIQYVFVCVCLIVLCAFMPAVSKQA